MIIGCASLRTGLERTPTPGISTSTTSPGASGPTPAGVPVAIRSPGSRVMTPLMYDNKSGIEKIISLVRPRCRSTPLTRPITSSVLQSRPFTTRGPTGQKVSKPLARAHCPSVFWRSRAVTSLTHTNPPMPASASARDACRSAAPDDHADFRLVLHLRRGGREDDRLPGCDDRARRLEEKERALGHRVPQFLGVLRVVPADADDLRRRELRHSSTPSP